MTFRVAWADFPSNDDINNNSSRPPQGDVNGFGLHQHPARLPVSAAARRDFQQPGRVSPSFQQRVYPSNLAPAFPIPPDQSHNQTASSAASMPSATATMPPKRPSSTALEPAATTPPPPPSKQTKAERPDKFSHSVRKRLETSTRTGQACDRCKIRKIRCDGLPGSCSPCQQTNSECWTTDRITGRATSRGYVEELEAEVKDLRRRVRELECMLPPGTEIKSSSEYHHQGATNFEYNPTAAPQVQLEWGVAGSSSYGQSSGGISDGGTPPANNWRPPAPSNPDTGSDTWQQWTHGMATNVEGHEPSSSSLGRLSGGEGNASAPTQPTTSLGDIPDIPPATTRQLTNGNTVWASMGTQLS